MKLTLRVKRGKGAGAPSADAKEAALAWGAKMAPRIIRQTITETHPFNDRTGMAHFAWQAKATTTAIQVWSLTPYARYLNDGWAGGPMTGLVGKTVPLGNGLFRRVSQQSLDQGKWVRPPRPASYFFERAMESLQDQMEERWPGLTFTLGVP